MKAILAVVSGILLSGIATAADPGVSVKVTFVEMPKEMKVPADPNQLGNQKGVDMAAMPAVTTKIGEHAKIALTRDFGESDNDKITPQVGVKFSVLPTIQGDRIHFTANFDLTEFLGFSDGPNGKTPMFDVAQAAGMEGIAQYGKAVVLTGPSHTLEQLVEEVGKPNRVEVLQRKIVIILTFEKAQQ